MSKILIHDLYDTKELNQAMRQAVLGGYSQAYNSSPPAPGGPVPIPYPNTRLLNNTRQLTMGGSLNTEVTYDPMQSMVSY